MKNYTTIILDRSGSMQSIRDAAIAGFNDQLGSIQNKPDGLDVRFSMVSFSTTVDKPTYWLEDPQKAVPLTRETYVPDASTALYDAVYQTAGSLQKVEDADDKDTTFLTVIISDGQENASKISGEQLAEKIQELNKTGKWTFVYIGSNQDLAVVSKTLGISYANTLAFNNTDQDTARAFSKMSSARTFYYKDVADGMLASNNFMEHDDEEK